MTPLYDDTNNVIPGRRRKVSERRTLMVLKEFAIHHASYITGSKVIIIPAEDAKKQFQKGEKITLKEDGVAIPIGIIYRSVSHPGCYLSGREIWFLLQRGVVKEMEEASRSYLLKIEFRGVFENRPSGALPPGGLTS